MSQESLEEFIKIYESKPYLWQVKSKLNTITKRKNKKINITHKSMKTIQTRQKGNERIDFLLRYICLFSNSKAMITNYLTDVICSPRKISQNPIFVKQWCYSRNIDTILREHNLIRFRWLKDKR
jgi:hypothetical protein